MTGVPVHGLMAFCCCLQCLRSCLKDFFPTANGKMLHAATCMFTNTEGELQQQMSCASSVAASCCGKCLTSWILPACCIQPQDLMLCLWTALTWCHVGGYMAWLEAYHSIYGRRPADHHFIVDTHPRHKQVGSFRICSMYQSLPLPYRVVPASLTAVLCLAADSNLLSLLWSWLQVLLCHGGSSGRTGHHRQHPA